MKLVIFGLTVSSSWGNGHATLWRGLCRALERAGHEVIFFEKDVPYYALHRDLTELPGGRLVLYSDWDAVSSTARRHLDQADAGMVTSYCPDGIVAADLVLASTSGLKVFYDLDTPVTLNHLRKGAPVDYIGPRGLGDFDLVLSYTGGAALDELKERLGAKRVAPLYGSVDPDLHHPVAPTPHWRADLSYLGTYSEDRQNTLDNLFIQPARRLPHQKFLIGGAMYPEGFPWHPNVWFAGHVAPAEHPAFFCSSRLTLNVTRGPMAQMGYCPSGRLFEAAACGTPILSDWWEGLDAFFQPDSEILVARTAEDALNGLQRSPEELAALGREARNRTLTQHTAERRVKELEAALQSACGSESGLESLEQGSAHLSTS